MPTLALPSARPHAWYSNSTDGSLDYDNNPFAKKRRPSVYPEPEVAEEPKPPDSENFVAELVRRGTKKLTFTKPQQARTTIRTNIETTLSPLHPADEENAAPKEDSHEGGHSEGQKSKSMTWVQSISLFQRRLRRQLAKLGLGSRYVQDDDAACEQLILHYHIDSPAFSRSRTNFRDWIHGEEADHLSVWQTALWRPSYDRTSNLVRAAFGLQYLVPQLQSVSVLESHSRFSKSKLKAVVESSNEDVHDNSLQRLSVYIQLPRVLATSGGTSGSPPGVRNMSSQLSSDREKEKIATTTPARGSTVLIMDSRLKAIATTPLIAGEEPWRQLLEDLDDQDSRSGRLAFAVVGLAFEAVAAKWVHYILCMHNYIASLEESVYEKPADDSRTNAVWSVSKQLLQAERLLKFQILLLENIQNDFGSLLQAEALPVDWLRSNLDEFKRLSSEVEETLKKPTAQMVDLHQPTIALTKALLLNVTDAISHFHPNGSYVDTLELPDIDGKNFTGCRHWPHIGQRIHVRKLKWFTSTTSTSELSFWVHDIAHGFYDHCINVVPPGWDLLQTYVMTPCLNKNITFELQGSDASTLVIREYIECRG
ncbi:MAG: hypothetical protein Q9176_001505 [Flavoplaca citrina]